MFDIHKAFEAYFDTHAAVSQLNLSKDEIVFFKDELLHMETNINYKYSDLADSILQKNIIHKEDIYKFEYYLNPDYILPVCLKNRSTELFAFRLKQGEKMLWFKFFLSVPATFSASKEKILFLYCKELTSSESELESSLETWQNRFVKILKYNTSTGKILTIRERKQETIGRDDSASDNQISLQWLTDKGYIYPDDIESFTRFTDIDSIKKHFETSNDDYSLYYRRRIGNMFRWVRLFIEQSIDYLENEKHFIFYLEDVQPIIANFLYLHGSTQYQTIIGKPDGEDAYNKTLHSILSFFTEKYLEFFMIDLKNDLYIMYKLNPATVNGSVPYIGKYSEIINHSFFTKLTDSNKLLASTLVSTENIARMLENRASLEFIHTSPKGELIKSIITKIETEDGKPSKVIFFTMPFTSGKQLVVKTFGNFQVFDENRQPIKFTKKQSKQLLAYLVDKQGFPSSTKDIVVDVLEKEDDNLNAIKYVSTLTRNLIKDLESHGFYDIVEKEYNTLRINTNKIDCDYYHLLNGDNSYWELYHNEYMKEYSWAEATNAEILNYYEF